MPVVAYLANQFPSPVEPYVVQEIEELRRRGVTVIPCSALRVRTEFDAEARGLAVETVYLQPLSVTLLLRAAWLCVRKGSRLIRLVTRVLFAGGETATRRLHCLAHTWLGLCLASLLEKRHVEHIHVHHGYFASWIAMVAARVSGAGFSVTLHGSDLLLHPAFLDLKLKLCTFCVTVSEFNRRHILARYPGVPPDKIIVQRMGIDCRENLFLPRPVSPQAACLVMLAVGRLHPVKDHAFLVRACRQLKDRGVDFVCLIAGDGPERSRLERMIAELDLKAKLRLLGHVPHGNLDAYYAAADVVVLTSRSEGIPLVLMEAMSFGKPVLAPAITGIPELVIEGETGFLYEAGSLVDFVTQIELVRDSRSVLGPMRQAARQHVIEHFNRQKNLAAFCDLLLSRIGRPVEKHSYESPVLQQI